MEIIIYKRFPLFLIFCRVYTRKNCLTLFIVVIFSDPNPNPNRKRKTLTFWVCIKLGGKLGKVRGLQIKFWCSEFWQNKGWNFGRVWYNAVETFFSGLISYCPHPSGFGIVVNILRESGSHPGAERFSFTLYYLRQELKIKSGRICELRRLFVIITIVRFN